MSENKKLKLLVVGVDAGGVAGVSLHTADCSKNNQLVHLKAQIEDGTFYEAGVAMEAAMNGLFFGKADQEYHCLWNPDLMTEEVIGHLMALYVWYSQGMGVFGEDDEDPRWEEMCADIQRIFEIAEESEEDAAKMH